MIFSLRKNVLCSLFFLILSVDAGFAQESLKLDSTIDVRLANDAKTLEIALIPPSKLDFLAPPRYKTEGVTLAIYNDGELDVQLKGQSILLESDNSGMTLTDSHFKLDNLFNLELKAGQRTAVSLPFADKKKIKAGSYEGSIDLYLPDTKEQLRQPVKLNVRGSLGLAVLFLILGMVFGITWRAVSRNKERFKWEDSIRILSWKINTLSDAHARRTLTQKVDQLTDDLDDWADPNVKKALEEGLKVLKNQYRDVLKVEKLLEALLALDPELEEAKTTAKAANAEILLGNDEAAQAKLQELNDMLTDMLEASRSAVDFDGKAEVKKDPKTKNVAAPSKDRKSPVWIRQLLSFNYVYWIYRPIVSISILFLALLWGLQEIYFADANLSFGAGGLFEYLLLFGWGTAADVFSWEVIGKQFLKLTPKESE